MSSDLPEARAAVGAATQALQSAVDAYDEVAALVLGVNRTDLRCLEILIERESVTPSVLGPAVGLSTGSVTVMLDRLERLNYVTRSPDPSDRRKVIVRITDEARRRAWELYGPIVQDGEAILDDYSAEELRLVTGFLRRSRELYERHLAQARARHGR
jgi:DNA-binding MarR family transcriptional regulator